MDLPLYTTTPRTALSDLGSSAYQLFDHAVVLNQVMRQSGQDPSQVLFHDILLHLRDGQVTQDHWKHLMKQTPAQLHDLTPFTTALRLFPTIEAVVEHNVSKLHSCGQPVATIKAVHTGTNASKGSTDDASGLEPIVCLAVGARVMLSSNLWVDMGLVNGAMGTIKAICYRSGGAPPDLPVAITVQFDTYTGPTLPDGTVPITPLRRTWSTSGTQCSRLQLPLKLAWAVTIHKAQGLTLDKVVVDIGKKEFSSGLTFVACSRVRHLTDILFDPPFALERLANLAKSRRLQERKLEDARLHLIVMSTFPHPAPLSSPTPTRPPINLSTDLPSNLTTPAPLPVDLPNPSPPLMNLPTPSPTSTPLSPLLLFPWIFLLPLHSQLHLHPLPPVPLPSWICMLPFNHWHRLPPLPLPPWTFTIPVHHYLPLPPLPLPPWICDIQRPTPGLPLQSNHILHVSFKGIICVCNLMLP